MRDSSLALGGLLLVGAGALALREIVSDPHDLTSERFEAASAPDEYPRLPISIEAQISDTRIALAVDTFSETSLTSSAPNVRKEVIWMHENGVVRAQGTEVDGVPVGPWKHFHADGSLFQSGSFNEHGVPIGEWLLFSETGTVQLRSQYEAGTVTDLVYDPEGNLLSEETRDFDPSANKSERQGFCMTWHDFNNAIPSSQGLYRDGVREGNWSFWNDSGARASEGWFAGGRRDGYWTYYDEAGVPTDESGAYQWQKTLHANGRVAFEGELKDGLRHGLWRCFDAEGNETSESGLYKNGGKVEE